MAEHAVALIRVEPGRVARCGVLADVHEVE